MPSTLPSERLPLDSTEAKAELAPLLSGAGIAPLPDLGWIRVTGPDRVRWLNGMVTNSIEQLQPDEGCYCFVLNAQGRIQGDLTAFREQDALTLETDRGRLPELMALLDRFIIMDEVELADVSDDCAGVTVAGPGAAAVLQEIGISLTESPPLRMTTVDWRGERYSLIHASSPLVPRFELWSGQASAAQLSAALVDAGARAVSPEALDQLRILEGTPRYGVDIRNSETARDLPQETGQTRALHFNKGCYLGQEIVERIRSRGQVHRTFGGFALAGDLPSAGTALLADGKPAGELTSVAAIDHPEAGRIQLALGYIRREALERGSPLTYPGGTARHIPLPYTRP